jgi:hypothetical protein
MIAAGYRDPLAVTLRIGRCEDPVARTLQRALTSLGLPSDIVAPTNRAAGPSLRVNGRRRLNRLAELIGDPPVAAPPDAWP